MAGENKQAIIIKKIKKGGHGHHGGAWKVAYADFVTAMMAFFLLLWLLNVTTKEQKMGLAEYFTPASVSRSESGSGGVLGGKTMMEQGAKAGDRAQLAVTVTIAQPEPVEVEKVKDKTEAEKEKEFEKKLAELEQQTFEEAREQLRQAIQEVPELADLKRNLLIDMTPEGLRIQLVDQERQSMFPSGSPQMMDRTKLLLQKVAQVVQRLPNKISISGHTDSTPFRSGDGGYGNWELSTDRANASRRALTEAGVPAARIQNVIGKADSDPLLPNDPANAANRRISIVLLRDRPQVAAASGAAPGREAPVLPPSLRR